MVNCDQLPKNRSLSVVACLHSRDDIRFPQCRKPQASKFLFNDLAVGGLFARWHAGSSKSHMANCESCWGFGEKTVTNIAKICLGFHTKPGSHQQHSCSGTAHDHLRLWINHWRRRNAAARWERRRGREVILDMQGEVSHG